MANMMTYTSIIISGILIARGFGRVDDVAGHTAPIFRELKR
jgi:hypothetical protein